jgi:outer membrane protein OmpA-like peptidoglycan-associated protein
LHKASPGTLPESKTSARLSLPLGRPDTLLEREADAMASRIGGASAPAMAPNGAVPKDTAHPMRPSGAAAPPRPSPLPGVIGSAGSPLPEAARATLEAGFNTSFGDVRVHTGPDAARLARGLGARAFTHGSDIFFGAGESAGANALTAHELTHVLQQSGGRPGEQAAGPVSGTGGENPVQCSFTGSYLIPGSTNGVFEIDLQTREGAVATPATKSGLDGYIRFVPAPGAPNSNVIAMTQIVRLTDAGGTDVNPSSMPAAQAPRGALGDSGLRTEDDPLRGIEGGFFTDVHHRPNAASPGVPQGTFLSPRYNFQPAAPGTTGVAGQTPQPGVYGGGIGGVVGQTPGFKRSDDPADIRSAAMYDFPGTASATANLDFTFETAALGEDTMLTYGAVNWGFGLRAGRVVNEHLAVEAGTSATFGEALERHRDFYVHEPVAFYFDFDSAALSPAEAAKIDAFLAYLTRNPDVELSIDGYADEVGGASDYNAGLSLRRAAAVEAALLAKGIAAARINGLMIGHGASTAATTNAGTGDQGGNAALGADQSREANRWANRRAVVSFSHVPAAGP